MCLHGALCSIPFNMQHDRVLKKLNFDPTPGSGGGEGLQAKYL